MSSYNELYPSVTQGIIYRLSENENCPWHKDFTPASSSIEDITAASEAKLAYIGPIESAYRVRSGFKSVLDSYLSVGENYQITLLLTMFREKWEKLMSLYALEYNPLHAYIVEETGKDSRKTEYGKVSLTETEDNGTITEVGHSTVNNDDNLYGFNSTVPVPSDTDNSQTSDNATETRDLDGSRKVTDSGQDVDSSEHTITKKGNIGYTTPQDLIQAEFDLWQTPFFARVFEDIDKLIMSMVW